MINTFFNFDCIFCARNRNYFTLSKIEAGEFEFIESVDFTTENLNDWNDLHSKVFQTQIYQSYHQIRVQTQKRWMHLRLKKE
jgi:hypothetical protein